MRAPEFGARLQNRWVAQNRAWDEAGEAKGLSKPSRLGLLPTPGVRSEFRRASDRGHTRAASS